MNPVEAQIDLLVQIMPKAKTLGFIYSSSEVNSQIQVDLAEKGCRSQRAEDRGSYGFQRQ